MKQAKNKNFRDPVGLLMRMLKSRDRVAYSIIFREGLSLALKPLDFLLAPFEKRLLKKKRASGLPIILILGGSRNGTTLLYQTLSQYLPVSTFTNLSASFGRSPIVSGLLFSRFIKPKRNDFRNYFGSVSGLGGPNDGFHIWNRWFGEDRNHVPETFSDETLEDLRSFIMSWNHAFNKPLLNKNNRNSLCIPAFEAALPDKVLYVHIKRNPVYVVQSLIRSREIVQGDRRRAWGLGSDDADAGEDELGYIDAICRQVLQVEKRIEKATSQIDPNRLAVVHYEEFCNDPAWVIRKTHNMAFDKPYDEGQLKGLEPFRHTNVQRLPDKEFHRIQTSIANLTEPNTFPKDVEKTL